MRKIVDFLVFIFFIYAIFVTIDCLRLKSADDLKRPFVIIKTEDKDDTMSFIGLGYKMVYKVEKKNQTNDVVVVKAKEGAFILFETFTLWTKKYNEEE